MKVPFCYFVNKIHKTLSNPYFLQVYEYVIRDDVRKKSVGYDMTEC